MNTKMKMRMLSLLLCFVMLVGLMPTTAFAWTAPTLSGNGGDAWNIQLSDEGVLSWNTISEATSYDIDVDETATGGTVTKIQGVTGTSYNLINRFKELKLENGIYYFRIKANGPDTTSPTISFKYVSTQDKLSEPQNLRWDGKVAKWDGVANATEYEVKLYADNGYLKLRKTTTETQYDWTTYAADGYWFEVIATAADYRNSNAAESPKYGTYSWTAPTLSGNGGDAWNIQLSDVGVLLWNTISEATSYDIDVDETATGGTVTKIQGVTGTWYNLIKRFKELKLENGIYYFRIKANGPNTISPTISFKYVSTQDKLSEPQNLRWDGKVAKWDSVANATEYEVKLYGDNGYLKLRKTTTETQYDWTTYAADGYWFEVIATAADYRNSNAAESPKYGSPLVPNTYTVTYDANGGTGTMASENLTVDGGFAKNYTFPQCGFTAPDGKEFDKWQWYYNSNPSQTTDTTPGNSPWLSGSITVKALWKDKSNTYTVTYDANGGSGSMGTEYIAFENDGFAKNYTFPQCGFTAPDGKEFDKWQWYYNSNPSQTTDTTPGNSPWLSGSITVKALWKDVLNDIFTSQPANKSGKIGANIKVSVGIDITQVPNENTAYIVLEVQNGGNWDKVAESNRSNWGGSFDVSSNTACTKTYRYKVYNGAQWNESDTFTVEFQPLVVTFVDNEHSTQTEPINVTTYNTTVAKPNNPTYAGDTFYGWNWPYWNFESDVVTQDITLYAQWAGRGFYGDIPNVSAKVGEKARIILSNVNYNNSPTYVYKYDGANWVQVENVTNYGWYDLPASAEAKTETYKIVINHSRNIESNEFTVTWANSTHTISFNANGGSGTMENVTGVSGEYTLPANGFTAPAGKQFKAWSVGGVEKAVGSTINVTANTTVTAIWEAIEYNVTVTGGTASVGAGTPITKATMGTTVTLTAAAAPSGQMFDKWVVNGVVVDDANSATTTFVMPAGNVTAEATYKNIPVVTYTVTFNANGGTGSMADATGVSGDYVLPVCGFTAPNGKQFKAWSVGGVEKAVGSTINVTANTTVTAIWEAIEYNVTVTGGTASVGAGTPITKATMGTTVTLTAGAAPSGQMFDKWVVNGVVVADANSATTTFVMPAGNVTAEATYKNIPVVTYTVSFDDNGGTGSMADATGVSGDYVLPVCGFTAPNGKQFKAWSVGGVEKAAGDTITVNANTTVTAIWENIPVTYYTVTFDSNGGSAVTAQSIEAGQKATKPADPTKDGYDFKGWTLNGSAYDFNTAVNGNITLVATWEQQQVVPTTYTVSFAANGGTGTMADVTGISGEYTLPENGFTAPDGKQFKAWSVDGNEKAVGDKITVTANTTVKAIWENIPVTTYTVSFDANGGKSTMADVTGISGEYALPENGFTAPDGKHFKCWSVDGKEKAVGDKITVTADTTVKAVWETLPAAPADYDILSGANSKWTQDSDGNISVRGSGEFSKFVGVKVDGKTVDEKYYTVKEGSTIVTLKPEYLNTLTAGKHTLEIVWTDGTADTTFTVDAKPANTDTKSPQTGDNSMMWLWVALLFVSGFGVVATTVIGKKKSSVK